MFGREESFPPQPATARTATSATATRSGGRLRKKACIGRPGRSLIPGAEESYHDLSDHQREGIFAWCEANGVHYVTGIARNTRLEKLLKPALERVEDECAETGGSHRVSTRSSATGRSRRGVGSALGRGGRLRAQRFAGLTGGVASPGGVSRVAVSRSRPSSRFSAPSKIDWTPCSRIMAYRFHA